MFNAVMDIEDKNLLMAELAPWAGAVAPDQIMAIVC